MEYLLIFLICRPQLVYCMCFTAMEHSYSYRELDSGCYRFSWWPIWSSVLSKPRPEKRVGQHSLFSKFTQPCMLLTPIAHLRLLYLLYSSMSLLLLVFPSLPLIVSSEYFIYPFIVSKIPSFFLSLPYHKHWFRCHGWYSICFQQIVLWTQVQVPRQLKHWNSFIQSPIRTLKPISRKIIKEVPPLVKKYRKRKDDG